jgi:hypothetical protein
MAISGDRRSFVLRRDSAYENFYARNAPELSFNERFAFHDSVVDHIGSGADLLYLEFGVAKGASLTRFASKFVHPAARFIGFDSFVGLPEPWAKFDAGHFSLKGKPPRINDSRVEFVEGWFQNSVPVFFNDRLDECIRPTVLIHYDADLYSSTLFLLTAFWWKIENYYFIMDEFYGEELIALRDFADTHPVDIEFYSAMNGGHSERLGHPTPHKVFGRIRNKLMTVEPPTA